jgi:inorganic pyrophosphatase
MNLLKDIAPGTAEEMNVIVEINKGSKNKYEIDKATGIIALDRVFYSTQDCPFDYGFVPQTLWEDGDALDVVLLTTYSLFPGLLLKARPVGLVRMTDSGEPDAKILAVPVSDPRWDHVQDLADVNKHTLKEIEHYFLTYKQLQKKVVTIDGFGDKAEAVAAFHKGVDAYKK